MATERFRHLRPAVPLAPRWPVSRPWRWCCRATAARSSSGWCCSRLPMAAILIGRLLAAVRVRAQPVVIPLFVLALTAGSDAGPLRQRVVRDGHSRHRSGGRAMAGYARARGRHPVRCRQQLPRRSSTSTVGRNVFRDETLPPSRPRNGSWPRMRGLEGPGTRDKDRVIDRCSPRPMHPVAHPRHRVQPADHLDEMSDGGWSSEAGTTVAVQERGSRRGCIEL